MQARDAFHAYRRQMSQDVEVNTEP